MSKIICDVCGTSYPDTAAQCPICGCVRSGDARTVAGDTNETGNSAAGNYTYVKGGRFSKSNVRKRNRMNEKRASDSNAPETKEDGDRVNKGLTIAAVVLLLAVVAVVLYIILRFFGPSLLPGGATTDALSTDDTGSNISTTEDTAAPSTDASVPCTGLTISNTSIVLKKTGASWLLNVTVMPANTTDAISYESADETVATVTGDGKITAVAPGETVITIRCGNVQTQCTVNCEFEAVDVTEPSTDPSTVPPTEETTVPNTVFELNRSDITLFRAGDSWRLYNGSIAVSEITWTSDDESVATIEGGKVVAVAPGTTKVHGEYDGVKATCIIRCSFAASDPVVDGNGGVTEDGNNTAPSYTLNKEDVTISVGESFTLRLLDAQSNSVSVTWTVANSSYCSVEGNKVTGVASGTTKVYVNHEGTEYSCIVRVR